MGTRRALRVALIQAGRIVEDRTFTGRVKITVGTDARSTFLVPMAEVPVTTAVFNLTKTGTSLLFDSSTQGRVSLAGADAPLQDYAGRASAHGSKLSLPLPEDARGRVSIGEVSLLFQFVDPPKRAVAAELPKGARGLIAQLDRSFIVILAVSIGAHFAGAGYLSSQPLPEDHDFTIEEMNVDRFARMLMPLPQLPRSTEPEKPTVAEAPKPRNTEPPRPPSAPLSAQALEKRVRTTGMMGLIGSRGDGQSGFADILKDTGVTEIAEALRGTQPGVAVASVEDVTASARKGNETGVMSEIARLGTDGVKQVELGEATTTTISARVRTEKIVIDTPDVDERALTQWLNGRKGAIQSCYERELKRSPKLAGRLVIKFTITNRGRVSNVGFDEDSLHSAQVQHCISALMRGWVLPFTPDDEVPVTLPFIFSASN